MRSPIPHKCIYITGLEGGVQDFLHAARKFGSEGLAGEE